MWLTVLTKIFDIVHYLRLGIYTVSEAGYAVIFRENKEREEFMFLS
jgi:hypothetical protein